MSSRRRIYTPVAGLLLVATAVAVIAAPASSSQSLASATQLSAVRFALVVDGTEVAVFGDLVALTSGFETSQLELSVGGSAPKLGLPTKRMPPSVTLRRGLTANQELWDWHDDALLDVARARKNSSLVMYDAEGKPVAKWNLVNAWPSKLDVGDFSAGGAETTAETVTIVCERLQRVSV